MMYTIYKIVNPRTKKPFYVGCTYMTLEMRMTGHMSLARRNSDVNVELYAYMNKLMNKGIWPKIIPIQRTHDRKREFFHISELGKEYKLLNYSEQQRRLKSKPKAK